MISKTKDIAFNRKKAFLHFLDKMIRIFIEIQLDFNAFKNIKLSDKF